MSLQNLPEEFLYRKIPEGVIDLDTQGIIQAVVGGVQDRVEDLRAYTRKYELLLQSSGLPESGDNAILVTFVTAHGITMTRSLDILPDTPASDKPTELKAWAEAQLGLESGKADSVTYGVDLLRRVDANTLQYLAATVGAILYSTTAQPTDDASVLRNQQQILDTWFPRLKIKGTAQSFDALGRLIGFEDVRMTPQWGRLSPRLPNDYGSPVNDPDFSDEPDYWPRQSLGPFYNPHKMDDGPFFTWNGTVSSDPTSTSYYTNQVNGLNPWIKVVVESGTTVHPVSASGPYVLAGGAPHAKASVSPSGSGLKFEALGEGDSFNGVSLAFQDHNDGTDRVISITDRLSAIKYRTSYFDLAMTLDDESAQALFGTTVAKTNDDLEDNPTLTSDGTAASPYRPWRGGALSAGTISSDFLVRPGTGTLSGTSRTQATIQNSQLDFKAMVAAGVQAVDIMEEVRAATRFPRRTNVGLLRREDAIYAAYGCEDLLFETSGTGASYSYTGEGAADPSYAGSGTNYPLAPYKSEMEIENASAIKISWPSTSGYTYRVQYSNDMVTWTNASRLVTATSTESDWTDIVGVTAVASFFRVRQISPSESTVAGTSFELVSASAFLEREVDPSDSNIIRYADLDENVEVVYSFSSNSYTATFPNGVQVSVRVRAHWRTDGTEVIRPEPDKFCVVASGTSSTKIPQLNFTAFDNFDVEAGYVDLIGRNADGVSQFDLVPGNGLYVDMVGSTTTITDHNGSILSKTAFDFEDGKDYKLILQLAGNQRAAGAGYAITTDIGDGAILPHRTTTISDYLSPFTDYEFTWTQSGAGSGKIRVYHEPAPLYNTGLLLGAVTLENVTDGEQMFFDNFDTLAAQLVAKPICYQERPEDQPDIDSLLYEVADEYPWRRDVLAGGELVEDDTYRTPLVADQATDQVEEAIALKDQTGADWNLYGITTDSKPIRMVFEQQDDSTYVPGKLAIGFKGSFKDLNNLTSDDTAMINSLHDLDVVMQPGWELYHLGLVQGVLVADPQTFNADAHRTDLTGWLPFNEHPDDDLEVRDVSSVGSAQVLAGVVPGDRVWDDRRGWHLNMRSAVSVTTNKLRHVTTKWTVSFWAKVGIEVGTGSTTIFEYGPLKFTLNNVTSAISGTVENSSGTPITMTFPAVLDEWKFFAVSIINDGTTDQLLSFAGGMDTVGTSVIVSSADIRGFNATDLLMTLQAGSRSWGIHDLRIWDTNKTTAQLETIRYHAPNKTEALYTVAHLETLNRQDRHGLKILDSGWAFPDKMPAWVRTKAEKRIRRYTSLGEYQGEGRFKEVGLGGGRPLPSTFVLGQQFFSIPASGTAVVATQHGQLPGWNKEWNQVTGQYVTVSHEASGSTSAGFPSVGTQTGTLTPWPNLMVQTNPNRDRIYVEGDSGAIWEVQLETNPDPVLTAGTVARTRSDAEVLLTNGTVGENNRYAEFVSGPVEELVNGSYKLSVDSSGTVYQKPGSYLRASPDVYMYANTQVVEQAVAPDTFGRWEDPNAFGSGQVPPVAARQDAGEIAFVNGSTSTTIPAGNYRLSITSRNIGKVDRDFDGFNVEITLGDVVLSKRLLSGMQGNNISGTDVFDFEITTPITGVWVLSILWTNNFDDPDRGTTRQLAIDGYELRELTTELYKVSLASSGTTPDIVQLDTRNFQGTTPGGWLVSINSYGTAVAHAHEARVYPENDTLRTPSPLANMLTPTTAFRREDHLVDADVVLPASGTAAFPSMHGTSSSSSSFSSSSSSLSSFSSSSSSSSNSSSSSSSSSLSLSSSSSSSCSGCAALSANTFSPVTGSAVPQSVTISNGEGTATIWYTDDGTDPETSQTVQQYTAPISVSVPTTIKTFADAPGFLRSPVSTASYVETAGQVEQVQFSPETGESVPTVVTLSTNTSGADIYYDVNSTSASPPATLYTSPIALTSASTVRAYATKTGLTDSAITAASYGLAAEFSFSYLDASFDRAGGWYGFAANGLNDFHFAAVFNMATSKVISRIFVTISNASGTSGGDPNATSADGSQVWDTKNINAPGGGAPWYPLVVYQGATQKNVAYTNSLNIPVNTGSTVRLDLYGQIVRYPGSGEYWKCTVFFADASTLTKVIQTTA